MQFEDAMTGTLCGGVLLALLFMAGAEPQPAANGTAVAEIDAKTLRVNDSTGYPARVRISGYSGCTEK